MPEAQLLRCFQRLQIPQRVSWHTRGPCVCPPAWPGFLSVQCGCGSQAPSHPPARTRDQACLTEPPHCPPGVKDSFVSEARDLDLRETASCFSVVTKTVTRSSQVNHQLDPQLRPTWAAYSSYKQLLGKRENSSSPSTSAQKTTPGKQRRPWKCLEWHVDVWWGISSQRQLAVVAPD